MSRIVLASVSLLMAVIVLAPSTSSAQEGADAASLLKAIQTGDELARVGAIEKLGKAQTVSSEAIEALRELYLTDSSEKIRRAARVALSQIQRKARKRFSLATGAKPFQFGPAPAKESEKVAGLAAQGTFGFGMPTFDPDDYVEPAPPSERVAKLIEELKADPQSSIAASEQLAKLGEEALPASQALVEVMMRGTPAWRDAQLAATEALDKIFPELQEPVWTIILEESTDMSRVGNQLAKISALGPRGHAALPVVYAYWNAPAETGYRVNPELLITMHVIGLKDPEVTKQLVRVLKGELPVGDNTMDYAIEIVDQRDLSPEQILELLTPHLPSNRFYNPVVQTMTKMVEDKQVPAATVANIYIQLLKQGLHLLQTCEHLGHLGPDAKEALPVLKRLKFEHQDERVRKAAEEAMLLIDM